MALDKETLKSAIQTVLADLSADKTPADAADALATAIDTFVKSGTVSVDVATTGSATAQTGTGTGSVS